METVWRHYQWHENNIARGGFSDRLNDSYEIKGVIDILGLFQVQADTVVQLLLSVTEHAQAAERD